jgi:hypothetical protein
MKIFEYYKNGTVHGTIQAENKKDAENKLFAEVEEKDNIVDLFKHPKLLPFEVQLILEKYQNINFDYKVIEKMINELNQFGYTCDYDLEAEPYELKLMKQTKVFKIKNNKWVLTRFDPFKKQVPLYDNNLRFKEIGIY